MKYSLIGKEKLIKTKNHRKVSYNNKIIMLEKYVYIT